MEWMLSPGNRGQETTDSQPGIIEASNSRSIIQWKLVERRTPPAVGHSWSTHFFFGLEMLLNSFSEASLQCTADEYKADRV